MDTVQKELEHFRIGSSYGGNQDWMRDPWMKLGGCAALAAVDTCLYLTLFRHVKGLCPVDAFHLTQDSYITFGNIMKPYISPRFHGVDRPELYTEGFSRYLAERGCDRVSMDIFRMGTPLSAAQEVIRKQLDEDMLIPMLHLRPQCKAAEEYEWHWFLLNGWRESEDGFQVKAVTYGSSEWVFLRDLWHETDAANGALILYSLAPPAR